MLLPRERDSDSFSGITGLNPVDGTDVRSHADRRNEMTIRQLKDMIADLPDDFTISGTGVEGAKVVPVSGTPEPSDRELVLYLEAKRPGRYKEIGTYLVRE